MKKAQLLWLDLEMTGLDPIKDRVLEVAAIATDWDFTEVATLESAVKVSSSLAKRRMVGDFWQKYSEVKDSLLDQNRAAPAKSAVEQKIIKFINKNFTKDQPIYLAGNSIHQDRKFLERWFPDLNKKLHYRMLDVSAWKIVFEHKLHVKFLKPENHRALDDIRGSIEELKYYLGRLK